MKQGDHAMRWPIIPAASGGMPCPGNYREFERMAFGIVQTAIKSPCIIEDAAAALAGAPPEWRNRMGYLLSLAGLPDPWPPEPSPPAALFAGDPALSRRPHPDEFSADALAAHWNLVRGADLGRLRQFLRSGVN